MSLERQCCTSNLISSSGESKLYFRKSGFVQANRAVGMGIDPVESATTVGICATLDGSGTATGIGQVRWRNVSTRIVVLGATARTPTSCLATRRILSSLGSCRRPAGDGRAT